jgi:hypothetical protein
MTAVPENFLPAWRRVVRLDAVPTRKVRRDDPTALRQLTDSLLAFADGRDVLIDSAMLPTRPENVPFADLAAALRRHVVGDNDMLACAVDHSKRVWALIEDEHAWLLFEDA